MNSLQQKILRIVDSLEESCHCNESTVCITSVECVEQMLATLEQICKGAGITPDLHRNMTLFYRTASESGSKLITTNPVQLLLSKVEEFICNKALTWGFYRSKEF